MVYGFPLLAGLVEQQAAVGAAQILIMVLPILKCNLGVTTGNGRIRQHNLIFCPPAQAGQFLQTVLFTSLRPFQHDQPRQWYSLVHGASRFLCSNFGRRIPGLGDFFGINGRFYQPPLCQWRRASRQIWRGKLIRIHLRGPVTERPIFGSIYIGPSRIRCRHSRRSHHSRRDRHLRRPGFTVHPGGRRRPGNISPVGSLCDTPAVQSIPNVHAAAGQDK